MFREISLGAIYAERPADFGGGMFFDDVEVVDGVVRRVDLAFNADEGFAKAKLLPLGFPKGVEAGGWIGEVFG